MGSKRTSRHYCPTRLEPTGAGGACLHLTRHRGEHPRRRVVQPVDRCEAASAFGVEVADLDALADQSRSSMSVTPSRQSVCSHVQRSLPVSPFSSKPTPAVRDPLKRRSTSWHGVWPPPTTCPSRRRAFRLPSASLHERGRVYTFCRFHLLAPRSERHRPITLPRDRQRGGFPPSRE